ncbi:unnamed protein product [Adineta ricciae]|uniref:Uncharacterized protein n=1 Tax=Adineta ricciae TaxID=249248 RepID=A0A813XKE7_ADIRI|nr:unnamed protein product [Adineta ricciae]
MVVQEHRQGRPRTERNRTKLLSTTFYARRGKKSHISLSLSIKDIYANFIGICRLVTVYISIIKTSPIFT